MIQLKRFLQRHNISYRPIADATGLSPSLIADVCNENVPVSQRFRSVVSRYLLVQFPTMDPDMVHRLFLPETSTTMLSQDCLVHFKFKRDPFINEITDPVADPYLNLEARRVEQNLLHAIRSKAFCALIGRTGSGKSTIMDRVIAQASRSGRIQFAMPRICETENLHAGAIYDSVIYDFGCPHPPRCREARARKMFEVLCAKKSTDCVLIVEEAHRLHHSTLHALKSFYDTKLAGQRLLCIILVGQPPLKNKIQGADMEEVARRCHIYELKQWSERDVQNYLHCKLSRVGRSLSDVFADGSIQALAKRCTTPLETNCLAAAAMNLCFDLGQKTISREIVNEL